MYVHVYCVEHMIFVCHGVQYIIDSASPCVIEHFMKQPYPYILDDVTESLIL